MLLHKEERNSADECEGTKVSHENTVSLDKLLVGAESNRCRDTDGDSVGDHDQSGTSDVAKIVKLQFCQKVRYTCEGKHCAPWIVRIHPNRRALQHCTHR